MSLQYQTEEDELRAAEPVQQPMPQPLPIYTIVLIAAIGAVFLVQMIAGLSASIDAAAFDKPEFLRAHQYWRILTGAALHGGPLHVIMNCYAFFSFGKIFELLTNRAHLAIVFLLSAIGGGVLSLIFVPDGVSVGASGGIVGLIGYLAVYAFRRRHFISAEFRKNLLINIGFILIFGLVLFQQIDNFGHIGGLIVGAVYAFLQIPADDHADPREAANFTQIAGLCALGIYVATCFFSILLILHIV
ncbi:MAG: rhomboid family intramembrane serine protease [Pyrinomonadaceae bacterium]